MKLIISLLLLSIISFSNGTSYNFLNLVPYSDSKCTSLSDLGIGFSFVYDTCFSVDNMFTHKAQKKNNMFVFNQYFDGLCQEPTNKANQLYQVGECIQQTELPINFLFNNFNKPYYYKIVTSSSPIIPKNAVVYSYIPEVCQIDNALVTQYIINGTVIGPSTYYCNDQDQPYSVYCPNNQCTAPYSLERNCMEILPFYNYTQFTTVSAYPTGGYSGSGAANTGSVSGSSGSSSGGYSTSQRDSSSSQSKGYSPKVHINVNHKYTDSDSSSSPSSSNDQYYENIYCS